MAQCLQGHRKAVKNISSCCNQILRQQLISGITVWICESKGKEMTLKERDYNPEQIISSVPRSDKKVDIGRILDSSINHQSQTSKMLMVPDLRAIKVIVWVVCSSKMVKQICVLVIWRNRKKKQNREGIMISESKSKEIRML